MSEYDIIKKRIKMLKSQLKETKKSFEEHDSVEDMHKIDQLKFTIAHLMSVAQEITASYKESLGIK